MLSSAVLVLLALLLRLAAAAVAVAGGAIAPVDLIWSISCLVSSKACMERCERQVL